MSSYRYSAPAAGVPEYLHQQSKIRLTMDISPQDLDLLTSSDLLDSKWYMKCYPDVAPLGLSAAEHYLCYGTLLLRDPGPRFSTRAYLEANPDVAAANYNALLHYVKVGCIEGRALQAPTSAPLNEDTQAGRFQRQQGDCSAGLAIVSGRPLEKADTESHPNVASTEWEVRPCPPATSEVVRWCLDSAQSTAGANSITLRGWALPLNGQPATVIVRSSGTIHRRSLNECRPDVIHCVLATDPAEHEAEMCGFQFTLDDDVGSSVEIGLEYDVTVYWAWFVSRSVPVKVLEGSKGWLYLHNDSNRSVDQYTGRLLLDNDQIAAWSGYFAEVQGLAQQASFNWLFMVAPAKEYVYPEFYGHSPGSRSCMDQMLEEVQHHGRLYWPLAELRESRELTYWKGDTHWTEFGAGLAARTFLERLGQNVQCFDNGVKYRAEHKAGDLSGKFIPKKTFAVMSAEFPVDDGSEIVFDNGIHNHGRLRIYECAKAVSRDTCVIFGGSSSVDMVPWLARHFARLVYAHSVGAVDLALIERERPQVVLLQTSSRFVVTPLSLGRPIELAVRSKLADMSALELDELRRYVERQAISGKYYSDWMAGLVSDAASTGAEARKLG